MKLKTICLVLLCGALLLAPALSGSAQSTGTVVEPYKTYVLNKNADLWPEKEAKGTPYKSDVGIQYAVTVLERDGEWTRVEMLDGGQGYMRTYYLGGQYMIRLKQHVYAMREKSERRDALGAVSFDRATAEDLIVLWEDEGWYYVVEITDGLGGYIPKDTNFEIIEYP